MQPTVEERATRTAQYLDLLASPTSPIVSVAMQALVTIQKSGRLDNAAFVARAEPVLYAATKTPPMQALKILADIANADPGLAARAIELAVVGLEHKHSDVQAAALDIIETHGDRGDDDLRAAVEERAALMEAAMRARTAQWLPTVEIKSVDTEFDDLDQLLRRARTLSEELANRSGLATVTAEIEDLSGAMPAIYDDTLALITRRITTSRDPRRFLWPRRSSFLSHIVRRCLTAKRSIYASIPFSKTRSSLRRIDRSMTDRYWRWDRPCNPHSGNVWLLFEMLARLDQAKYPFDDVPSAWHYAQTPDELLTDYAVLKIAYRFVNLAQSARRSMVDSLIVLIEDGRLDGTAIGECMRVLLSVGATKSSGWGDQLAIVAAESPLHTQVVRNALERALCIGPEIRPHNIHNPLELLLNLCIETEEAITDARCRAYLKSVTGNSRAARQARQLLALEAGNPRPYRRAAAVVALRGRLARAERWAERL